MNKDSLGTYHIYPEDVIEGRIGKRIFWIWDNPVGYNPIHDVGGLRCHIDNDAIIPWLVQENTDEWRYERRYNLQMSSIGIEAFFLFVKRI